MDLEAGRTLAHYRLVDKLGEGGMGVVWKAIDTQLEREVALKILPADFAGDATRLGRFEREARTVAALSHPNIVTVHSVEQAEGVHFFVMELLQGDPLNERIPADGMPLADFLDIAIPLTDALSTAHEHGVTHRDLKPANILVTDRGQVKILDFGLARTRWQPTETEGSASPTQPLPLTRAGRVVGTWEYMSPEQATGQEVDSRSDLFSLGIVMYEMVTGKNPFADESPVVTLSAILRDAPRPVKTTKPRLPAHLGRIIHRCLCKEPDGRFQTAQELGEELQRLKQRPGSGAADRFNPRVLARLGVAAAVVALIVFAAVNFGTWRDRLIGSGSPRIESLAVLPVENLSGDPEQEYFADGMTDALIGDLARIGALRVISRTSVMTYRDSTLPLPQIARELDVDAVVEGSVLRQGNRVRISATLIEAATDRNLWSRRYERDLEDVIALQSEVAREIAREIRIVVTPDERAILASPRSVAPQAYELYLKGRYYWNQRTEQSLREAIRYLDEALEVDPDYARAYAGIADSYTMIAGYSYEPPAEALSLAKAAGERALEIDGTLAEAHTALAMAKLQDEWDWSEAESGFARAIELNPGYATAHHWYALLLAWSGRDEEALARIRRARSLDPLSLIINTNYGWIHYFAGRYDEAEEQLRGVLELNPRFATAHWKLGHVYRQQGRYAEAIEEFRTFAALTPTASKASLAYTLAASGQPEAAREILEEMQQQVQAGLYVSAQDFAEVQLGLGETTSALDSLDRACTAREAAALWVGVDPLYEPLRDEPRFPELLRRLRLAVE